MLIFFVAVILIGSGILLFMKFGTATDKQQLENTTTEKKEQDTQKQSKPQPGKKQQPSKNEKSHQEKMSAIIESDISKDQKINKLLNEMSLEEKIGQMFVVGFQTDHPTEQPSDDMIDMLENKYAGGVILFDRNMKTKQQVTQLNENMKKVAQKTNGLPLFTSLDQEGGEVARMQDQYTKIPSQQELAKTKNKKEVQDIAARTAKELKETGFNVNFAPVLDLSNSDTRSFGVDPEKTFQYGKAVIDGFHEEHVTGALKHFPGHGRSNIDPHHETSSIKENQEALLKSDIYPFKQMIQKENHENFFVMVTHIKYPSYDQKMPASLSSKIITDLLRDELDFDGIVATDDLEMDAVRKYYSFKDMGVEAVNAGADLLLVCHDYDSQVETYKGLVDGVKKGKVTEERIDESVTRILKQKLNES